MKCFVRNAKNPISHDLVTKGMTEFGNFESRKVKKLSGSKFRRRKTADFTFVKKKIDYLRFYVPLKNFSLIWRRHYCRWRAAKFRPLLGAQGLWAGRDLYRATPSLTRDLGFSGLIRRTAPFSRLLRHTRGCGGSILTRNLTRLLKRREIMTN
jgi:hypothetical protein